MSFRTLVKYVPVQKVFKKKFFISINIICHHQVWFNTLEVCEQFWIEFLMIVKQLLRVALYV